MPEPEFVGNIQWKQQRGSRYSADNNGKDSVELVYRGPSSTALNFRSRWRKGDACPETGFGHCTLISLPDIKEDDHAYSTAILRFEGATIETTVDDPDKDPVTSYSFEAQHASFAIAFPINRNLKAWYTYYAKRMTARYVTETRPTGPLAAHTAHADSYLKPDPKPLKIEDFDPEWEEPPKANALKKGKDYQVVRPEGAFSYEEEGGIFTVTEIHEIFIETL
tara:strand:- start:4183 stop:4848 length:666 start_codon:yes stop_codon:yes gene_type:complete